VRVPQKIADGDDFDFVDVSLRHWVASKPGRERNIEVLILQFFANSVLLLGRGYFSRAGNYAALVSMLG